MSGKRELKGHHFTTKRRNTFQIDARAVSAAMLTTTLYAFNYGNICSLLDAIMNSKLLWKVNSG